LLSQLAIRGSAEPLCSGEPRGAARGRLPYGIGAAL